MAQSLFKVVKQRYPDVVIDVLAPGWSKPLLQRMPEVRDALELPWGHGALQLKQRIRHGRALRGRQYDWSIVLPNSLKSAIVPAAAHIHRRTGYVGEMRWGLLNDARRLNKKVLTMTVQRFVALADGAGVLPDTIPRPQLQVNGATVAETLKKFQLSDSPQVLALCPGAEYGPAKRWPEEYFAKLAAEKLAQGWQVWLFGSDKDLPVAEDINRQAGGACVNLAGRTSLAEAVDLMSRSTAVVSNDSGLMHVAAALDLPVVAVYGSSDPGFTPPLSDKSQVLTLGLACSPCFKRECPLGHLNCLRQLPPGQVSQALDRLLDRP